MKNIYNFKYFQYVSENFMFEQYEISPEWNDSQEHTNDNFFKYIKKIKRDYDGMKIDMPFTEEEYDNLKNKYKYNIRIHPIGTDIKPTNSNYDEFIYFGEVPTCYYDIKYIYAVKKYLDEMKSGDIKFCDMGCGSGNVVYFAKKMGYDAIGVELQKERLESRHKELNIKVIYGDFFNLDLSFLKDMDVIYLYRPIANTELSTKLLDLIYNNTKKNVIIMFAMGSYREIHNFKILNYNGFFFLIKK